MKAFWIALFLTVTGICLGAASALPAERPVLADIKIAADPCFGTQGAYKKFWNPSVQVHVSHNVKLSHAQGKHVIDELLKLDKLEKDHPHATVRFLSMKTSPLTFGILIEHGCIVANGWLSPAMVNHLINDGPLPVEDVPGKDS